MKSTRGMQIGINGWAKRGIFNNGTQWTTARVYRGFPRAQKSMWLLGASVLRRVVQGNCCGSLWGKLLWLLQGGMVRSESYRGMEGGRIYLPPPDMGRRGERRVMVNPLKLWSTGIPLAFPVHAVPQCYRHTHTHTHTEMALISLLLCDH